MRKFEKIFWKSFGQVLVKFFAGHKKILKILYENVSTKFGKVGANTEELKKKFNVVTV